MKAEDLSKEKKIELYDLMFPRSLEDDEDLKVIDVEQLLRCEDTITTLKISEVIVIADWMIENGLWTPKQLLEATKNTTYTNEQTHPIGGVSSEYYEKIKQELDKATSQLEEAKELLLRARSIYIEDSKPDIMWNDRLLKLTTQNK